MACNSTPLVNSAESCVDELLEGLTLVNTAVEKLGNSRVIVDKVRASLYKQDPSLVSPVALVTGGGSGHEPFAAGYVGGGLVTAAVAGSVFASPPVTAIETAIRAAASTAVGGVLVIVFNYTGDRINFAQAVEKCRARGLKVGMFVSGDDSALRRLDGTAGRRGLCGTMFVLKIIGALAANGAPLAELLTACTQISLRYSTLGVALSGCHLPGQTEPLFTVQANMLELGLGVHGEAGVDTLHSETAGALVHTMIEHLLDPDSDTNVLLKSGDQLAVIVNNLGGMTQMELLIIAREVHKTLVSKKFIVARFYVGCLMTSLNMRGFHISLLRVTKLAAWLSLLDQPTSAPAWPTSYCVREQSLHTNQYDAQNYKDTVTEDHLQYTDYSFSAAGATTVKLLLERLVADVPSWKEQLNKLDTGCGDGDCGATLCEGADKLRTLLPTLPYDHPVTVLRILADTACDAMGGTSGGLYSILFGVMANSLVSSKETLKVSLEESECERSCNATSSVSVVAWIEAFREGVDAIAQYGGAQRGHKTMLDALYPAADAGGQASPADDWRQVLLTMSQAADEGSKASKHLTAKAGRASCVRGGASGKEDAGARAVANILCSLAKAAAA